MIYFVFCTQRVSFLELLKNQGRATSFCRHAALSIRYNQPKPGDHPNFKKKALRGKKRPFSELGILGAALGLQKMILGMRNPILGMASHDLSDLCNAKTTILGATPGAIPGIHGNPLDSCDMKHFHLPVHSRRVFFKNWGGACAPEPMTSNPLQTSEKEKKTLGSLQKEVFSLEGSPKSDLCNLCIPWDLRVVVECSFAHA